MVPRKRDRLFLGRFKGIAKGTGLQRKSPLTILSFDRQRRFLSHAGKKAGLKTLQRKHSVQKNCWRQLWSKQEHSECQFRPQARASHGSSRRYRRGTGRAAPHIPPEGRSRETLRFGREPRRRAAAFPREARAAPLRRGMEAKRNRRTAQLRARACPRTYPERFPAASAAFRRKAARKHRPDFPGKRRQASPGRAFWCRSGDARAPAYPDRKYSRKIQRPEARPAGRASAHRRPSRRHSPARRR